MSVFCEAKTPAHLAVLRFQKRVVHYRLSGVRKNDRFSRFAAVLHIWPYRIEQQRFVTVPIFCLPFAVHLSRMGISLLPPDCASSPHMRHRSKGGRQREKFSEGRLGGGGLFQEVPHSKVFPYHSKVFFITAPDRKAEL